MIRVLWVLLGVVLLLALALIVTILLGLFGVICLPGNPCDWAKYQ